MKKSLVVFFVLLCTSASAVAQQLTKADKRERQELQKRVEQLEQEVAQLKTRIFAP